MSTSPAALWLGLSLGVLGWGAVLVLFSVRIVRFVLAAGPRGIGISILKLVATVCLVLLYLVSPFGQMLATDIVYSLIAPGHFFDLSRRYYAWITPAIGAVSIAVTALLVRERAAEKPFLRRSRRAED